MVPEIDTSVENATICNVAADLRPLLVPLASVYRDPGNLNDHDSKSIEEIAGSYREFGQLKPLVVNDAGMILAGNGQHEAAEALGWTHIAVTRFDGSDVAQLRFAIADNATGRLSHFKEEPLAKALKEVGPVPGFDQSMVDSLFALLTKEEQQQELFNVADALEADPTATQVKFGQLWQLGQHRLLCGSALDETALTALLHDPTTGIEDAPGLVFADPPYGIDCVGKSGSMQGKGRTNADTPKSIDKYATPKPGGERVVDRGEMGRLDGNFGDARGFGETASTRKQMALLGGAKPFGKNKAGRTIQARKYLPVIGDGTSETAETAFCLYMGRFPRAFQVWWGANHYASVLPNSPCWLFWNKEMTGTFADGELAYTNGKKAVRMFTHQWNGMMKASERGTPRIHPNQKPTVLAAWVFAQYGIDEMIVLDPFCGSGPTLWAAENLGLRVRAIEMSPDYCSLLVARWEALTGESAVLLAEGVGTLPDTAEPLPNGEADPFAEE